MSKILTPKEAWEKYRDREVGRIIATFNRVLEYNDRSYRIQGDLYDAWKYEEVRDIVLEKIKESGWEVEIKRVSDDCLYITFLGGEGE